MFGPSVSLNPCLLGISVAPGPVKLKCDDSGDDLLTAGSVHIIGDNVVQSTLSTPGFGHFFLADRHRRTGQFEDFFP